MTDRSPQPRKTVLKTPPRPPHVTVVGIGEDGWEGLGSTAREAVEGAGLILGGGRQLALLPVSTRTRQRVWPSPMSPFLDQLARALVDGDGEGELGARRLCLLASGSPMLHGVGASLAERGAGGRFDVIPQASIVTHASAALGWVEQDVALVSACGRPLAALAAHLAPGARILILSADETAPHAVAALLRDHGCGRSRVHVLERLGGPEASVRTHDLPDWPNDAVFARLNAVAVEVAFDDAATPLPRFGLPDDAFDHDGQITRRDLRLAALSRLRPEPGALLWDIGAGAGSIGVEWCRVEPRALAIGIERSDVRVARARANAARLGAVAYRVLHLDLPGDMEALLNAEPRRPDAIFLGGGATAPGLLGTLLGVLAPGGRLVAHGVTLETEAVLAAAYKAQGGELTRIQTAHADPIGRFTGLRPAMAVTQWSYVAPSG